MIYFYRIDVSEGVDVNIRSKSKECDFCHYWYFLNKGIKFQPYACNRCHELLMMSMNLKKIAILKIKNVNYCCIITGISKTDAIKIVILLKKVEHNKYLEQFESINLLEFLFFF